MISPEWYQHLSIDLPPLLTAIFVAATCALLGNLLVLRRTSLLGDAISHAVLPGIVLAFLVSGTRGSLPVFIGAALAGVCATLLIELVGRFGRIESGAAMGVVFSVFFAAGVILIEQAAARSVDLDADCLLHGQLETIFWYPPHDLSALLSVGTLFELPRQLVTGMLMFGASFLFILIFFKELKIVSFDPALATSLGINATFFNVLTMVMVAGAVVASFEAVGSILVIAMLIVPPATARLLTDRYNRQLYLSVLIAVLTAAVGYLTAAFGPILLGFSNSLNTAGTIATLLGLGLASTIFLAPTHGILARRIKNRRLSTQVVAEDILGLLYRLQELKQQSVAALPTIHEALAQQSHQPSLIAAGLRLGLTEGLLMNTTNGISLTPLGEDRARQVVRTHRLWETYLVRELGLRPDHVHQTAEQLEHFTPADIAVELGQDSGGVDPHGKRIPSPPKSGE